jgi:putative membrane-bound dehydrogenase-like protein
LTVTLPAVLALATIPLGAPRVWGDEAKPAAKPDDDTLARELPRIPAHEPDEAIATFRIHPGFQLKLRAAEPEIAGPVSVCYDADGRIYAAEMRDYPYPEGRPGGLVRLLEDRDGDGCFETSRVFLDKLAWPTGVVPYDGGVFITAAPDIIYAKDTNGDGVADVRKVMFSGFGVDNVQGLLNGLLWGPDGWIYGVASSNGGEIVNKSQPDAKPVSVRGRDFRFKPDGSAFEAISGGGQFGHAFDDWGHRFSCNNSNHIRQIVLPSHYLERNPALIPPPAIIDIAAEGAAAPVYRISSAEPWRIVRTRQRAADPEMARRLPPTELVAIGFFTSATGVTIYRGSAYPESFRGNAFMGDVGGNLVHRKTMAVHGSSFLATRADEKVEFLASTDNWFRPVNFANTPDGTLLILDMYRETIEHPHSIPEPIKKHLDLTSGKERGRLYELVHESSAGRPHRRPALSHASTAELVSLLADPDAWWRETAQRLLIERRDQSAIPSLVDLARRRPTPQGRLHALWTLDVLGGLEADVLQLGLLDEEPRVREQAVKLCDSRIADDERLLDRVASLAGDSDSMVRFQVAFTLGEAQRHDRAIASLAAIAAADAADVDTRAAVLSSIAGRASALLAELGKRDGFFETEAGGRWLDELSSLVGAEKKPAEIGALLSWLGSSEAGRSTRIRAVLGLAQGVKRGGGTLREVVSAGDRERLQPLFDDAASLAGDDDAPASLRLSAIRLLGQGDPGVALDRLPSLLDARLPASLQLTALQALAGLNDPAVGGEVVGRWKAMSPSLRREAVEVLFGRKDRVAALVDAMAAHTLPPSEIDPARLQQLRNYPDRDLRSRAIEVLGAAAPGAADRGKVIEVYRSALSQEGDRGKGREVFLKTCATCHLAEGQGKEVGPNLATITGRSPEDLLIHILDPNREVAPNYVNYNVATVDGRVISGIIAEESTAALVLKRAEGATDAIPRAQIEAIASTGTSLMPEGLEKGLASQDFADLIAYLRTIQTSR